MAGSERSRTELALSETEGAGRQEQFRRPLQAHINGLATVGCLVDQISEVPVAAALTESKHNRATQLANAEIPLFLALRGLKLRKEGDRRCPG